MKFVRLCKSVSDKGILIEENEVIDNIDNEHDWYVSTFKYSQEQFNQFQKTKSVAGVKDVSSDKLNFDFDSKDIDSARQEALIVLNRLEGFSISKNDVEIYFSGGKGFHLSIRLDRYITPEESSHIALNTIGKGLETLDRSIYNASRILRVPATKHQLTNLYKIPLTPIQLKSLSVSDIKQLATNLDNIKDEFSWEVVSPKLSFYDIPKVEVKVKTQYKLNLDDKPNNWKNCKWSILQGNFKSGERHNALMVLAATCRGFGFDKETTYYLCKSALKKQASVTGHDEFSKEELWKNIIENSIFTDGWEGGTYSCKSHPWLKHYCESLGDNKCKDETEDKAIVPITIGDVEEQFVDHITHIEENTIKTGIRRLDKEMPFITGSHVGIVGSAGSGKSSIALEILRNTSKSGVVSVMASLDMHRNRMFEKLLYKVSGGISREDLYDRFKRGDYKHLVDKIKEEYGNVWFYDRSSPTVEDLRSYILKVQELTGKKVKLVLIDYFERINSERSEDTAASKDVAGKLQDLVNDFNICLVTLVQPNKMSLSGGPDQPIKSYTAIKGSSFLYQSFRGIIGIWRPFFSAEWKHYDKFMQMAILKNDLGELDLYNFKWVGKTGDITELTPEGESDLERCLEEKETKKSEKSSSTGWD